MEEIELVSLLLLVMSEMAPARKQYLPTVEFLRRR